MKYKIIKRKNQKKIIAKLKEGEVIISTPYYCRQYIINEFIDKNQHVFDEWIYNYQKYQMLDIKEKKFIYIFGIKYQIIYKKEKINKININQKIVYFKNYYDKEYIYKYISKYFYFDIYEILNNISCRMGYDCNLLKFQKYKNKWGVCFIREKMIKLNYKIIHFDKKIINYIIIHEMAHIKHPNHSKKFWNYVEKFSPQYKIYNKELKNYSGI